MSTHEAKLGNLCVSISENSPRNSKADASAEIIVKALKSANDSPNGGPWSSYHVARLDVLVRRDRDEFPYGLLTEEAEAAVVAVVRDFFARNRTAEQQPAATPAKAPETAAANNV